MSSIALADCLLPDVMKTQTERTLKSLEDDLRKIMETEAHGLKPLVCCRVKSAALQIFIRHCNLQPSGEPRLHCALSQSLRKVIDAIQQKGGLTHEGVVLQAAQVVLYYEGERYPYAKRSLMLTTENRPSQPDETSGKLDRISDLTQSSHPSDQQIQDNETSQVSVGSGEASEMGEPSEQGEASEQGDESSASSFPGQRVWNRWLIIKAAAAGIALTLAGVSTYALTRPCVIGECGVLAVAQTLNEESHQILSAVTSPEEVVTAYEKLVEANYQLARIPFWSSYYADAQHLLTHYQAEADVIAQIVEAQRQAYEATLIAQEPPHPLAVWEMIRGQWQEAIAQLERVPPDTTVANLANSKRTEYQTYLSTVDQRITQEQEAQTKILAARQAAQIAEDREGAAESAEDWQLVYVTWQVVINRLNGIPKDTMAYAEAQHLHAIYSSRLTASRDRHLQEQLSYSAYTQALTLAEQAMQDEGAGRLTAALTAWQNAITTIQQIPEGTSYYEQAQPLLTSYTEEQTQAEQTLNRLTALERHRPTLNQACTANVPVCSYTLGLDGIRIFMVDSYAERLRQFFIAGISLTGDSLNQSDLARQLPKMAALLQTITAIGNDSQISVEVFDSQSQLIATYDPNVSGYIQAEALAVEPSSE